jgi:lysophospholipid acyltransferase (LPLAT)-like uncharacterized protein
MSAFASPRESAGPAPLLRPTRIQRLVAFLVFVSIRALAATLRVRVEDGSGQLSGGATADPVIFTIWHNRLALALVIYNRYVLRHHPQRRLAAMVSASRDGAMLARALELFGVQPVRGSTSRRGPQALRELTTWGAQGYDLAITPDGPRGPCYVVQSGVVSVAQLTGLPIVPVSYHLNRKTRLNSWDRFQIPWPLTRCTIRVGDVLRVPRDASEADRDRLRQELEARMRGITND